MPRLLSRRAPLLLMLTLSALTLPGCPIYDDDARDCHQAFDCLAGYRCAADSERCVRDDAPSCERPTDCERNETCAESGQCVTGDCSFRNVGCVSGYECSRASGIWQCIAEGSSSESGGSSNGGGKPSSDGGDSATAGGRGGDAGVVSNAGADGSTAGASGEGGALGAAGAGG